MHTLCDSDPAKFHHIEGRFTSPVLPGEALTVDMWRVGDGEAVFVTRVDDRPVLDQGLVRFSS
jgi:acyl dehydratase